MPAPPPAGAGSPEDLVRFQTAILAQLAREVVSVDRFADLAAEARSHLAAAGLGRVRIVVGDGTLGVPDHAPYQAIVVAAASPHVPWAADRPAGPWEPPGASGRPRRPPAGHGLPQKGRDLLVDDARLIPARFVPLVGAHGTPSPQARDGR